MLAINLFKQKPFVFILLIMLSGASFRSCIRSIKNSAGSIKKSAGRINNNIENIIIVVRQKKAIQTLQYKKICQNKCPEIIKIINAAGASLDDLKGLDDLKKKDLDTWILPIRKKDSSLIFDNKTIQDFDEFFVVRKPEIKILGNEITVIGGDDLYIVTRGKDLLMNDEELTALKKGNSLGLFRSRSLQKVPETDSFFIESDSKAKVKVRDTLKKLWDKETHDLSSDNLNKLVSDKVSEIYLEEFTNQLIGNMGVERLVISSTKINQSINSLTNEILKGISEKNK